MHFWELFIHSTLHTKSSTRYNAYMQFTAHLDDLNDSQKDPKKNKKGDHFELKVNKGQISKTQKNQKPVAQKPSSQKTKGSAVSPPRPQKEKLISKENLHFVLSRVLASVLIFIVGYIGMNWSAFSQIFERQINEYRGIDVSQPYHGLGDTKTEKEQNKVIAKLPQKHLEISNDPEVQKKQVPELDLAITPPDMRIIIPRIGSNVPVVPVPTANLIARDWAALENDIQGSLRDGVVHYPGTAFPDQIGNVVLTGHSSYFPWDPGRFKDVFALLHQVQIKDKVVIYYDQKKFIYQVSEKSVVLPDQIDVLGPSDDSRVTLITCTPIGTNEKRLIVEAVLIEGELADGTEVTTL